MNFMRKGMQLSLSVCLLIASFCLQTAAQENKPTGTTSHTRYRIIFTGTFGGPNGHFAIRGTHILNNNGSFVGWADDSLPDPFAPDACWDGDCFVARAFYFKNGEMTDLGSLAPGFSSDVSWLSPGGLISGEAQTGLSDENGWTMHGVLWDRGKMIDLGTLDGGPVSLSSSVNDAGEVAGFSLNTIPDPFSFLGFFQTRAYRWKNGVMQDLGTLGGPDAMAVRINERGQIAGNSYIDFNPSDACRLAEGAFLWDEGKMSNLGGLGGTCTTVADMNNRGQIVGGSLLAGDKAQHAFLWQRGTLSDLGTLGGNFAAAVAINESGDVSGVQSLAGNDALAHATLWTGGQILDLGALNPDGCSIATNSNSQQQTVGVNSYDCDFDDDPSLRAILSERGGPVVDLNTLIPPNSGVQLRNASIINERGEIVAAAYYADGNHGPVLLVPCDGDDCQNSGVPLLSTARTAQKAKTSTGVHRDLFHKGMGQLRAKQLFGPMGKLPRR